MPTVWVLRNNAGTKEWDPAKRIYVRDKETWKPIGTLNVRSAKTWPAGPIWSPNAPTGINAVNSFGLFTTVNLAWNTSTGAPVDHYEIRRSTWSADHSQITTQDAPAAYRQVAVTTYTDTVAAGTSYSYEIRAIGKSPDGTAPGQSSAWSDPFKWKTGVQAVYGSYAVYGWDPDPNTGPHFGLPTTWTATSSHTSASGFGPERAINYAGWNNNTFGWVLDGQYGIQPYRNSDTDYATVINSPDAPGRLDFRMTERWYPGLILRPDVKVQISGIQVGHWGTAGYRYVYPGTFVWSPGRQTYILDRMDSSFNISQRTNKWNVDSFAIANMGVPAPPPRATGHWQDNDTLQWRQGWSPGPSNNPTAPGYFIPPDNRYGGPGITVDGPAGETIRISVVAWTPVAWPFAAPGELAVLPFLPNIQFVNLSYRNWVFKYWQQNDSPSVAAVSSGTWS